MGKLNKRMIGNIISEGFKFSLEPEFPKNRFLVELSNYCNHACIFCANQKMQRKVGHIDKELLHRVLEEAYELGTREVGFYTTGEPFVSKDLEIHVKKAKEIGYDYVYITTNGSLASPDRVQRLLEYGLDSLKFSINAGTRETYEFIHGKDHFEQVKENITSAFNLRNSGNYKCNIYISSIQTDYTLEQEKDFLEIFEKVSDEIVFLRAGNQGGLMPEVGKLIDTSKNLPRNCVMPFNSLNVTCEGYLTPCCVDFNNSLAIADLNKVSLAEAWHSDTYKKFREDFINNKDDRTICYLCRNGIVDTFESLTSLGTKIDSSKIMFNKQVEKRIELYESR